MPLRNSHDISLREVFCFVPISNEALEFINPYRTTKKVSSLKNYYNYRKKLRSCGESYIDEIDSQINEFKIGLSSNFGINYVSEAITTIINSVNIYEYKFLTSYFGLNLKEPFKRKPGLFLKALNTKNKLLDKLRRPTFLYVIERTIELNKKKIFNSISQNNNYINCENLGESIKLLNGEHKLAIELHSVYYKRFLDNTYFKSENLWLFRDENKLERVIAKISRK